MKKTMIIVSMAAGAAWAAAPTASIGSVVQDADSTVTVSYTLSGAPAVVTFGVLTNTAADASGSWVAVGGEAITGGADAKPQPEGDVFRCVETGSRSFKWRPSSALADAFSGGGARLTVTVWPLGNTPPYMVVNLLPGANDRVSYYPDADSLPGGLISNVLYRTGALVMRKIPAKGVKWKFQNFSTAAYQPTMTNNYYMGVFEVTQAQWRNVYGAMLSANAGEIGNGMLPMETVSYRDIRESVGTASAAGEADERYMYPNPPCPDSFLGKLRSLTGIDFDLPSEIEWEYAARAGYSGNASGSNAYWNDGTPFDSSNPSAMPGRNFDNRLTSGYPTADSPAECGSYAPSDWGLYDMHGNVFEWCLDWYVAAAQDTVGVAGRVNAAGKYLGSAPTTEGTYRVARGGCFRTQTITDCLAGNRAKNSLSPTLRDRTYGFRVVCRAGLE